MSASTLDLNPNDISFSLSIELPIPPAPIENSPLVNVFADKKATLTDITAGNICRFPSNFDGKHGVKHYSDKELNTLVIYEKDKIEFSFHEFEERSCRIIKVHSKVYHFPSNKVTIKQFVDAIIEFEKFARPMGNWFGGIDCNHIFYEGIDQNSDGTYSISWGS